MKPTRRAQPTMIATAVNGRRLQPLQVEQPNLARGLSADVY
jgi:hypothetical protein